MLPLNLKKNAFVTGFLWIESIYELGSTERSFPFMKSIQFIFKAHDIVCLSNHHRGLWLCGQIKPNQRLLSRELGCNLLTKPNIKEMTSVLTLYKQISNDYLGYHGLDFILPSLPILGEIHSIQLRLLRQ